MTSRDIIENLARTKTVERLVDNLCPRTPKQLGDLVQMIYEALLRMPPSKLRRLHRDDLLVPYIIVAIRRQYFSVHSSYHIHFRRPMMHAELSNLFESRHEPAE